jgi:hypothetical protein
VEANVKGSDTDLVNVAFVVFLKKYGLFNCCLSTDIDVLPKDVRINTASHAITMASMVILLVGAFYQNRTTILHPVC